jgi:hypothetical protein
MMWKYKINQNKYNSLLADAPCFPSILCPGHSTNLVGPCGPIMERSYDDSMVVEAVRDE